MDHNQLITSTHNMGCLKTRHNTHSKVVKCLFLLWINVTGHS